jgi:ABC-type bacteriocin/lantibiotic exporter with double-glycine peptidase domain
MKLKGKEKGTENIFSFFEAADQKSYNSLFAVIGQNNKDSCVAATIKMWLHDIGIKLPESYISAALETQGGAYLSKVPELLAEFGFPTNLVWKNNLSFPEFKELSAQHQAIVPIKLRGANFGHAVIVDGIIDNEVMIRDSLPVGQGKSYAVSVEKFKEVWLRENNTGSGIIYDQQN